MLYTVNNEDKIKKAMTVKIDKIGKCDFFEDKKIVNQMKKSARETHTTRKESGFAICLDNKGKIYPNQTIPGTKTALKRRFTCPSGTKRIGSFHTHTGYEQIPDAPERMFKTRPIPSVDDLLIAIHEERREKFEKVECVGLISSLKTFDVNCFSSEEIKKEMESPIIERETKEWLRTRGKAVLGFGFREYLAHNISLKLYRDAEYRLKLLCKERFNL